MCSYFILWSLWKGSSECVKLLHDEFVICSQGIESIRLCCEKFYQPCTYVAAWTVSDVFHRWMICSHDGSGDVAEVEATDQISQKQSGSVEQQPKCQVIPSSCDSEVSNWIVLSVCWLLVSKAFEETVSEMCGSCKIALVELQYFAQTGVSVTLIMATLWNRAGHYIFSLCFLSYSVFFFSRNLSGRRLDVYRTSTHGVALVRI